VHCNVDETLFKLSCNVWIKLLSSSRGVLAHHERCGRHVLLLQIFHSDKLCNDTQLIEPFKATGFLIHACGCGAAHACGGCFIFAHFVAILLEVPFPYPASSFSRSWQISSLPLRCTFPIARNCRHGLVHEVLQLGPNWSCWCLSSLVTHQALWWTIGV
jgi:hypothetical protein